jgi:hypothetical protein
VTVPRILALTLFVHNRAIIAHGGMGITITYEGIPLEPLVYAACVPVRGGEHWPVQERSRPIRFWVWFLLRRDIFYEFRSSTKLWKSRVRIETPARSQCSRI